MNLIEKIENKIKELAEKSPADYKKDYKDFDYEKKHGKVKRNNSNSKSKNRFGGDTGKDADYKRNKKAPGETK